MKKRFTLMAMLCCFAVGSMTAETLHAYNLPGGGYVVLDEDNAPVALGEKGTVDNMSAPLRAMLSDATLRVHYDEAPARATALVVKDSIGPLLGGIMYDQSAPYNRQTPMFRNQHCLTGCVATAMAQIMRYHRHPRVCSNGSISYVSSSNKIQVNYTFDNVTFDWNKILETYTTGAGHSYTEEEANEVAKLMAACGASVEMDYGLDASGSISRLVPDAFVSFFGYHMGIDYENRDDFLGDDEFHAALIGEIKAKRPIYTSGASSEGGHAYVIDGYLTYEGAEAYPLFHFNWGWSGVGNEWVTIKKSSYNQTMAIIRNIRPAGITAVENQTVAPVREGIYDLLGNRVAEPLSGHIYIVNGVKKLIP